MINLPKITLLEVKGYALYPGTDERPDLRVEFGDDLTLIVGANGLGKSTLLRIIHAALAGPSMIPATSILGDGQLKYRKLSSSERRTFADRVDDGAASASVSLQMSLGEHDVTIRRSLANLELQSFEIDGISEQPTEHQFETAIVKLANIGSYLDWLLLLRYLVLYGDDRPSLVWDTSAQRRLLRLLFLENTARGASAELEAEFLSIDSRVRNSHATLQAQRRELRSAQKAAAQVPVLEERLSQVDDEVHVAQARLDDLDYRLQSITIAREDLDLRRLQLQRRYADATEQLNGIYETAIRAALPSFDATSTFIYTQLLSGEHCRTCGNDVPEFASEIRSRLSSNRCVVCGSVHSPMNVTAVGSSGAITSLERNLSDLQESLYSVNADIARSDEEEEALRAERSKTGAALRKLQVESGVLRQQLPDRTSLSQLEQAISDLLELNRLERAKAIELKTKFAEVVEAENRAIAHSEKEVKARFDYIAAQFLVEECELVWSRSATKVGQLGQAINYSIFEVDMSGGGGTVVSRRNDPSEVSESQAQFIDLAFRMALIEVAASGSASTLIIDTPESSLDSVFAPRAARILNQFAGGPSRLLVTSNLTDGKLIPTMARLSQIRSSRDPRVVNLLEVGRPTAATLALSDEYEYALEATFSEAG